MTSAPPLPFASLLDRTDLRWVLAENEHFFAVLETRPLVLGHVVIVSKIVEDHLLHLPREALGSLLHFAKPIADAIERTVPCRKIGIAVIGLETRHAHLHLVPIDRADDLDFTRAKITVDHARLREIHGALHGRIASGPG